MTTPKAQGLLRKARALRHRARAATVKGRTFDAATFMQRALNLEAQAEHASAFTASDDDFGAGFRDADIPSYANVSLNPRDWC